MRASSSLSSDQLDRRHLLELNLDAITRMMTEATWDDPVGFIIDATDKVGRELALHLTAAIKKITVEQADVELSRLAEEYKAKKQSLTMVMPATWEFAEDLLPGLSPTASGNLQNVPFA